MDANDARTDAPITDDETELSEFDPAKMPLGTFAAFDVSDQPLWTTKSDDNQYLINDDQKAAIKAMVDAAAKADSVPHRIEIQQAWMLELLDRGLQRFRTASNGGWEPFYGSRTAQLGVFGAQQSGGYYDTNVIGEKNDIIVACLTREIAEATFFPEKPQDPDDEVYAQTANCLKHFIAEENLYGQLQAEVARLMCTDEAVVGYTRPVADAQRWGYESTTPDVVPETEDGLDPDAKNVQESDRPKIRTLTSVYGKLSRKVPILAKSKADWQYAMLAHEIDVTLARAKCPWIASEINAGDLGIAELKLDRLARQSVQMALQSQYATGDSLMRDVTETYVWFRPGFYTDDSCPKTLRSWFWENFPKGMLAAFESGTLAFVRNESMDEVLTEFHARSGNGQNRRALTESYAGPQMRLNTLVDLRDEFCRKTIPRVGLDTQYWNVDALRSSSVRVGVYEPALQSPTGTGTLANSIVQFPVATGTPDITAMIDWISGPLAEQLTHAVPALAASDDNDPETAFQSKLQNDNAMAAFGESWKSILHGFANMTTQAVAWNARVQKPETKFDSNFNGKRVIAEIAKLKSGSGVARADATSNFPELWSERRMAWMQAMSDQDPSMQAIKTDPRNLAAMQEFMPRGMVLPGVDAVKKQQAEFDVLLKTAPIENPRFIQIQMLLAQGQQELEEMAAAGIEPDPQKVAALQQGQQMLQQEPPLISSVPVLPTDEDQTEALVCLGMINSAEGRRLASSKDADDKAYFQNLNMHYEQHQKNAAQKALQNQQPIAPKVSLTIAGDKLPPEEQAAALQKAGIAATPESIAQNAQQPHEIQTTEKGIGPTGSEIERKVSIAGKSLS
jgi:hypothetical protein